MLMNTHRLQLTIRPTGTLGVWHCAFVATTDSQAAIDLAMSNDEVVETARRLFGIETSDPPMWYRMLRLT